MKTYAKENYISNISDTISNLESNNSKSFWQLMGRFMRKNCNVVIMSPLRLDNTNSNQEKTNFFNAYFCGISSKYRRIQYSITKF